MRLINDLARLWRAKEWNLKRTLTICVVWYLYWNNWHWNGAAINCAVGFYSALQNFWAKCQNQCASKCLFKFYVLACFFFLLARASGQEKLGAKNSHKPKSTFFIFSKNFSSSSNLGALLSPSNNKIYYSLVKVLAHLNNCSFVASTEPWHSAARVLKKRFFFCGLLERKKFFVKFLFFYCFEFCQMQDKK